RRNALRAAVATTPGWTSGDNGLMHYRGVDDGLLLVLDGVPVYERLDPQFGVGFDPITLEAVRVLSGFIPPEFGLRSGGVSAARWPYALALGCAEQRGAGGSGPGPAPAARAELRDPDLATLLVWRRGVTARALRSFHAWAAPRQRVRHAALRRGGSRAGPAGTAGGGHVRARPASFQGGRRGLGGPPGRELQVLRHPSGGRRGGGLERGGPRTRLCEPV